jgi:hypothetical protein
MIKQLKSPEISILPKFDKIQKWIYGLLREKHSISETHKMVWIITFLCIMVGCTSKPPMLAKPVNNTWTIDSSFEILWKSGIEALVVKGAQIDILDKETGLIVAVERIDSRSFNQYVAEPYGFAGGEARVNILFIKKAENKTQVTIKPTLFGLGRSYYPTKVTSNGKLERDYYLLLSGSLPTEKTYEWLEDVEPAENKQ